MLSNWHSILCPSLSNRQWLAQKGGDFLPPFEYVRFRFGLFSLGRGAGTMLVRTGGLPILDEHANSDDEQETRRFRNGEDLGYVPLTDRKLRLRAVVPKRRERLLYCDHIDVDGEALFRLACENDLEGIVAKRKSDPYLPDHTRWLKIRNHDYSQWVGREKLFERERGSDPDFQVWDGCALACAIAAV